jgi:lipopolysaccharide export system permease protein
MIRFLTRVFPSGGVGPTLMRYFGLRFLKALSAMLLLCVSLVLVVDLIELFRRTGDQDNVTTLDILTISLFRLPSYVEQILPFAILFGAMTCLLMMSRQLELVIARAAGISVWQFLSPFLLITLLVGGFMVIAFNPLAASLKEKAESRQAVLFGMNASQDEEQGSHWLRQNGPDGPSILRAGYSFEQGRQLRDVTVFLFDDNHSLVERIDAEAAEHRPGHWLLSQARVYRGQNEPLSFQRYTVGTTLTQTQIRESFSVAEAVSFWQLPHVIRLADQSGLNASRYRLQYQSLLARPFLLGAMVLIAATVSLRVFRYGGIGQLIVIGIACGFMLYAINEIMEDVGGAGLIPPVIAAWLPAVLATVLGSLALLHFEDG